ncbi:MAG: MBL fold hydrolase [Candidatus Harrisonbacteria bacterium CG10_big_fil_rev_8_21_14_0_10_49_15]|uniref:MBL fold hydrolase n=1 Tax=Candidatus Harrisonbacteria bacterium CG10_big_fil_rev_8_21_14_0_10_49_15 TaxID=1974587 RepID=A0A2H0UMC8_9BACT|nr:MAG: MBL fold hydrolase [Candidatus Harrisonbacteria bacterium CG10_big_fil_rev_8_21_14_0_10_49_15]
MKLTFFGGAQSVTGANYLLEFKDPSMPSGMRKILVDCGMNQGGKFVEERNYEPFAYDPAEISDVFITHAHIDHTGLLPKLVKHGFDGVVHSTPPTRDFAELLLKDSMHILALEAERDNKETLYEEENIVELMNRWQGTNYHQKITLGGEAHGTPAAEVTLHNAGHILGSASIEIAAEGKKILFSGDLGNNPSPLIEPSEIPKDIDYVLMETVYGNRNHEDRQRRSEKLEEVVRQSVADGGVMMIPAFAMERTQILLMELKDMLRKNNIPEVPIFLDSPLAISLTAVYNHYRHYFKEEIQSRYADIEYMFRFPGLKQTLTTEESKGINRVQNPKIVIAGSGMSTAGRIIHHEKRYLPDPKSTLLIFGYQATGSLGRRLLDGEKSVRILGEDVPVRAHIKAIGAFSAHADQRQLLEWVKPLKGRVKKIWLVQGELDAATAFKDKLKTDLDLEAEIPTPGDIVEL